MGHVSGQGYMSTFIIDPIYIRIGDTLILRDSDSSMFLSIP